MRLEEICKHFSGLKLVRDGIFDTIGFANITSVQNMLVFVRDGAYLSAVMSNPNISAVISLPEFVDTITENSQYGVLVSDNPDEMFYKIHNYLYKETDFYNKRNIKTVIGSNCNISPNAVIADRNVVIGDDVTIEANAVIMEGVTIGDHCTIGANTTVGTRGFQYYRKDDDAFYIEHVGGVVIEDHVDILSGCCIASGLITPTHISENCKIDNLVHIGHSAFLEKRVLVPAGVILGGSSYIGKRVWLGINSTIAASVHIGDDAFVCMGAVVTKDVAEGQKVSGNFAVDHKKQVQFIKELSK